MATKASILLQAARKASLRSGAPAAAASRAAAMASRSAYLACEDKEMARRSECYRRCFYEDCIRNYDHIPDDSKIPTDKDLESDEAVWAFYERWCKAFNKIRDRAEMVRRVKIFRYHAEVAHHDNTGLPADPKEAASLQRKRRKANLLLAKGQFKSSEMHLLEYLPVTLGVLADGADPFLCECDYVLLKDLETREALSAPKDVKVE